MKLPNGHLARIEVRKLQEYSLSTNHEYGRHKAKLFHDLLGIEATSFEILINALK